MAGTAAGGSSSLIPLALGGLQAGAGILGGLGGTNTGASTYSTSGFNFPVNFLNQFTQYGPPQANPYTLGLPGSVPQGQSLFGFGGSTGTGTTAPPRELPPLSYDPNVEPTIGFDDLAISYVGAGGDRRKIADLTRAGFRPGEQYTLDQVRDIMFRDSGVGPSWASARSQESFANAFAAAEGLIGLERERRRQDQYYRDEYNQLYGPPDPNAPIPPPTMPPELVQAFQSGTATGQSWNPQTGQWNEVQGNPDLVYSGWNDTVYYRGTPVTDQNQLNQLLTYGPASAGIGPSMHEISSGIVSNITGPAPQVDFGQVPWTGFTPQDPGQFSVNPTAFQQSPTAFQQNPTAFQQNPNAYAVDPYATQIDPMSFQAPMPTQLTAPQAEVPWADFSTPIIAPQASEAGLTVTAPQISPEYAAPPPMISSPEIAATNINYEFTPEYLESLINERFLPQARELDRREAEMLAESEAMAAQRGLAGAGAWMAGERDYIKREFLNQVRAVHTDAANQAVTQFYGQQLQTALTQATLDQERRLAQAGFDFNAQSENARNLLTLNIANAEVGTRVRVAQAELDVQAQMASLDALTRIRTANTNAELQAAMANLDAETRTRLANLGAAVDIQSLNTNAQLQAMLANLDAEVRTNLGNLTGQIDIARSNIAAATALMQGNQDTARSIAVANINSATSIANANAGIASDIARANIQSATALAQGNQSIARDILLANQSAEVTTGINNMRTWADLAGLNMNTMVAVQNNQLGLLQEMGRDVRNLNDYDIQAASILTGQQFNLLGQIGNLGRFTQNITTSPSSSSSGLAGLFG